MKITNGTWESVKTGYLRQVEKALASAGHREKKQVLEDVRSHLDQRFSELGPDEQTWENMQTIITEMGPTQDYAELLAADTQATPPHTLRKIMVTVVVLVAVAATVPLLLRQKPGLTDISVDSLKLRPYSEGGLHYLVASIRNNGPNPTGKFEVHFYLGDPESSEAKVHGAGPIQPGDVWNEASMPFKIDPDGGEFTVKITPQNDNNPGNNSASISIQQEKPHLDKFLMNQGRIVDKIDFPLVDDQKEPIGSAVPPIVVSTTPMAFDNDVSPNLKEITVTFDQSMMNLSWSWVGGGETFPDMMGQPQYNKNKRTCTLPVKLEAGRFYWVGINSPQHKYFQTDMAVAAVPYVILFATRDENAEPTPIPENFLEEARSINSAHGQLAAVDSAESWLGLIDGGDYGQSWEDAADIFKNAVTKEQWAGMAKTVRQPLGRVISRQVISNMPTQTVPGGPDGEYVIIQFKTSFENKADSIETVTPMLDEDGVWRVTGYYIR